MQPEGDEPRRGKPARGGGPRRPVGGDEGELDGADSTFHPSVPPANPERLGAPGSDRAKQRSAKPKREETGGPTWLERLFFGKVSLRHKSTFCRQSAAYLDAGVDLFKALGSLQKQFDKTALGPVLGRVQQSIRKGDSFSEALAREPQAFDPQFLAMMRVAEARGAMPETLKRMSDHYDSRQRLLRQARSGMIYPVAVVLIMFVVGWLLTAFVLPALVAVITDMAGKGAGNLPGPTRALIAVAGFMKWVGWWAVPLGFVAAVFFGIRWYRTASGKAVVDSVALHIPVIGPLLSKLDTSRFARTMATLLDAGVDMPSSLDLTTGVVTTAPFKKAVGSLRPEIVEGGELSHAMIQTRRFASDAVAYVETGESTGKLPETLDKLADEYEEQVEYIIKNLGQLVQPLIVIVLGGFVLFIALAFVLAYIQLLSGIMGG